LKTSNVSPTSSYRTGHPSSTRQVEALTEWHLPETEPNFEDIATKHPNHVNFVEQRMSAEANIEIVDGAWYPNLNLTGSIGKVGGEWPPDSQRWSVGVTLTFPFFPGTSQIYAAQTARAERDQAVYEEHSTDYKLIAALESAYDALLDAVQQVEVAKVFQQGALARSRIANGKYSSGLMTFEDWSVIDTDLVNREQNLLQSQLNAMQAQATWEAAEGIGDI
jgi:outer membrane protein TolC